MLRSCAAFIRMVSAAKLEFMATFNEGLPSMFCVVERLRNDPEKVPPTVGVIGVFPTSERLKVSLAVFLVKKVRALCSDNA